MPRTRTFAELQQEALETADLEDSQFVDATELGRQVNNSIAELHDRLIDVGGPSYGRTLATLSTTAGVDTVALPTTFYKAYGVDVQRSAPADFEEASPLDWANRNSFDLSPGWNTGRKVYYEIEGANLRFWPTPSAVHSVRLWFVPWAPVLTGSDPLDGVNGFERFVVLDVAIWLRNKQEQGVAELVNERTRIEQRIEAMASRRDRNGPARPRDVRRRGAKPVEERWRDD